MKYYNFGQESGQFIEQTDLFWDEPALHTHRDIHAVLHQVYAKQFSYNIEEFEKFINFLVKFYESGVPKELYGE